VNTFRIGKFKLSAQGIDVVSNCQQTNHDSSPFLEQCVSLPKAQDIPTFLW
jgi:hypothetical protein